MPAQTTPHRRWTEEEFYQARDAAPPGERWELVDGEVLVTPSPNWVHQSVIGRLYVLLDAYVRAQGLGRVFTAPLDVTLAPGIVFQPDLLVVPAGELRRATDVVKHLLLAVETLSPGSARHDRVRKRPVYQAQRVPEYWIVDKESQTFECWRPDDERPAIVATHLLWHPTGASEPFTLDVPVFFAEVLPPAE